MFHTKSNSVLYKSVLRLHCLAENFASILLTVVVSKLPVLRHLALGDPGGEPACTFCHRVIKCKVVENWQRVLARARTISRFSATCNEQSHASGAKSVGRTYASAKWSPFVCARVKSDATVKHDSCGRELADSSGMCQNYQPVLCQGHQVVTVLRHRAGFMPLCLVVEQKVYLLPGKKTEHSLPF